MRFPFFNRPRPTDPVRVPLPPTVDLAAIVYAECPEALLPGPDDLRELTRAWLETHAEDPLRSVLTEFLERGLVSFDIQRRGVCPEPPVSLLEYTSTGDAEKRRFRRATYVILIRTSDLLLPPRAGLWGVVGASRAIAGALDGVSLDFEFPRLFPIDTHDEPLPADGRVAVVEHIVVPSSVDRRGLAWITTKGMSRFGLPELEVRDVPPNRVRALTDIVNGVAQHLVEASMAASVDAAAERRELVLAPEIRLRLEEIYAAYGSEEPPEPEEGARGWTLFRLEYRPSRRHDSFLRLVPPGPARREQGVWLNSLISDLWGSEDTLRHVPADSESMEAAHLRAIAELPEVKQRFQAGLPPGSTLIVKHGFPLEDDYHEYMWIAVSTWSGDRIRGHLANSPQARLDLREGQVIDLRDEDVFDWALHHRDGSSEGGYTNRVVEAEGSD